MTLKVSTLGPQVGEKWDFLPLKFLGGTWEHPYRTGIISENIALCGKVSRKSAQGRRKNLWWEIKK